MTINKCFRNVKRDKKHCGVNGDEDMWKRLSLVLPEE